MTDLTPSQMIEKYIALRNKAAKIRQKHVDELTPYNEVMLRLEAAMLDHLNRTKLKSVASPAGTAFKSTSTSVTVHDWKKTLAYIVAENQWDLLEARVAKKAAETIMEETKKPIPGVQFSQATVLRVRAA